MTEQTYREGHQPEDSLRGRCGVCYERWPCTFELTCQDLDDARTRITALEAALARLQSAWDDLCRCNDEFLPDYPEACGEYQHNLDLAVIALLATRAGADADG